MKFAIVFAALFALAIAGPVSHDNVDTLRYDNEVGPESHDSNLETSDGTKIVSHGVLKDAGTDHEAYNHQGSYSYVGDDGVTYTVNYVADENGFQPQGAHLPVAPEAAH
ncbi:hypothetical protein ACFFRR_008220 [Megaselia abdita]